MYRARAFRGPCDDAASYEELRNLSESANPSESEGTVTEFIGSCLHSENRVILIWIRVRTGSY